MTAGLDRLNSLSAEEAETELLACCGSREWARRVTDERPFGSHEALAEAADRVWASLGRESWLEAFEAHPKIGKDAGRHGDARSRAWSRAEQSGTQGASPETLANLGDANREYEERFGHIFIVCASGKNAAEMLALLELRLHNDPATELAVAAEEQRKITRLRLAKMLEAEGA